MYFLCLFNIHLMINHVYNDLILIYWNFAFNHSLVILSFTLYNIHIYAFVFSLYARMKQLYSPEDFLLHVNYYYLLVKQNFVECGLVTMRLHVL